jgi:ABC-type phosphate transport system substrate-binding protein
VRVRLVVLAVLAVAAGIGASACGSGAAPALVAPNGSAKSSTRAPVPSTTPLPKVYLAANGWSARSPVFEPRSVAVSADSSFYLESMTWTWSSTQAVGTGTGTVNTCQPDCADGKHISAPIKVTLTRPQQACGHDFFTNMVITWVARNPDPTGPRTSTLASGAPLC